jgi:hypothetical protein
METDRPLSGDVTDVTNDDALPSPVEPGFDDETGASLPAYEARVVAYDDEPDECTIFPADADDDELVTTWISAKEGAYVSLEAMR